MVIELVDFDEDDKKLYLDGLEEDIKKCEELNNNQLYNLILETIRQINEARERIDDLYIQYTALNNILSLRLLEERTNEFGCIGCIHTVEDEDSGDLECSNPKAEKGVDGVPLMVCSEKHTCPFYEADE